MSSRRRGASAGSEEERTGVDAWRPSAEADALGAITAVRALREAALRAPIDLDRMRAEIGTMPDRAATRGRSGRPKGEAVLPGRHRVRQTGGAAAGGDAGARGVNTTGDSRGGEGT